MHRRASIRVTFGISLALVVTAAGCGDPGSKGELTDEAADQATQGEGSGESSNAMEAGSEGGSSSGGESGSGEGVEGGTAEASEASDMADTSASGTGSETTGETETTSETETETGTLPIDCTTLDERECSVVDTCASYYGQPFAESIDGMVCLAPAEFLGCLFADQACLPATGTLCSFQGIFHVDNLCPPPDGFVACEPPIDPPPPSCP